MRDSVSSIFPRGNQDYPDLPIIDDDEPLVDVVRKLDNFLTWTISEAAYTFDDMKSHPSQGLRMLINTLAENSHNPFIISALMILKWKFDKSTEQDGGQNEARGYACEYVAWQFLAHLNQREIIEFLLEELRAPPYPTMGITQAEMGTSGLASSIGEHSIQEGERTPLLMSSSSSQFHFLGLRRRHGSSLESESQEPYDVEKLSMFFGLNALEIATIAQAKKFISQKMVQRMINNIWNGEIVFWDTLSVHSNKKPQFFNKRTADPYSRLRVPVYRKAFEAAFFVSFLLLYYAVLIERKDTGIGIFEALMYVWIAAFAYDEISGVVDSGMMFYQMTFWSLWDLGIIGTGLTFVITRTIGLAKGDSYITDLSFDILALEALFLVPRIFSLVSLNPYFGSLILVLKEMTKTFFRFTPVIIVLYFGFLTTFTMLARDRLSSKRMSWILVNVFFGSNYLGFDICYDISPIFGCGLMLIFVSVTSLLLISSLVSLMSMSLEGVMAHAREEYLFQLAIYVLESSNSRRLTYFMPPLNLIPLLCIRPMRLFLSAEDTRRVRIILLRATHLPFVALLWAYESSRRIASRRNSQSPPTMGAWQKSHPASSQPGYDFPTHNILPHTPATDTHPQVATRAREYTNRGKSTGMAPRSEQSDDVEIADLIDEVKRLRAQVERVAATMAVHQRNRR